MAEKDDRLDPLSENFDALASLYSDSLEELPVPDAPVLDNLSRLEENVEGKLQFKPTRPRKVQFKPPKAEAEKPPIAALLAQATDGKSVMNFMRTVEGPCARLRDCMERGARIRVRTRNAASIRGELSGRLLAFDKMWNLALEDVYETWTRKRKKKSTPLRGGRSGEPEHRVHPPRVTVTVLDRRTERCERMVPRLLLRGEHIVHLQILE